MWTPWRHGDNTTPFSFCDNYRSLRGWGSGRTLANLARTAGRLHEAMTHLEEGLAREFLFLGVEVVVLDLLV